MMFTALVPHGYPGCQCCVSVTVEGCGSTDGVVSLQPADHANLGELVDKGVAQIGRSSVERFATFWGKHGEFETTLIIKPAFSNSGYFPRARPSFVVFKLTAASIPFYVTARLFAKIRSPVWATVSADYLLFCCFTFWSGVGLTLIALLPGLVILL